MIDALKGTTTDVANLEESVKNCKTIRLKGRTLVTVRTAAVIIVQKKKRIDLKKFKAEASSLGVKLPQEIVSRLDSLAADA